MDHIEELLKDLRGLELSLSTADTHGAKMRRNELSAQIRAVENLRDDARRFAEMRKLALDPTSAAAASFDNALFEGGASWKQAPAIEEFNAHIDHCLQVARNAQS